MQLIFNCITVYSDTMSHIAHTGPSWNHILSWQWADPIMSYYDMFTFVFLPFFPDHSGGDGGPFNPTVCQLLLKNQWPGGHSLRGIIHSSDTVLQHHPRVAKYTCVYDMQLLAIWRIPLLAVDPPHVHMHKWSFICSGLTTFEMPGAASVWCQLGVDMMYFSLFFKPNHTPNIYKENSELGAGSNCIPSAKYQL